MVAHDLPQAAGSLIGAGVGATVSLAIFMAGRVQGRRQTALDLFKEYYSADFADQRRAAARFMTKHRDADWSSNDPYELGRDDDDLAGYGAVLRYWQRVATLYNEKELSRGLTQRLLSRELGQWSARIFEPMQRRKGMYVLDMVVELARRFSIGERPSDYAVGLLEGRRGRTTLPSVEETKVSNAAGPVTSMKQP
jgi:hypothetical protein